MALYWKGDEPIFKPLMAQFAVNYCEIPLWFLTYTDKLLILTTTVDWRGFTKTRAWEMIKSIALCGIIS